MLFCRYLVGVTIWLISEPIHAQRSDENVVTAAGDAFGASLGRESIGLYDDDNVRGFSPQDAGNTRIEGLYFDQRSSLTQRVQAGVTIRVGLTAIGFSFPAPTGVVDRSLRIAGDRLRATVTSGIQPNWGAFLDWDADVPLTDDLAMVVAAGLYLDENGTSNGGTFAALGSTLAWMPAPGTRLIGFVSGFRLFDDEISLSYRTIDGSVPNGRVDRTEFLGPHWALLNIRGRNAGLILNHDLGDGWRIDAGLFRSVSAELGSVSDQLVAIDADGQGERIAILFPGNRSASWSGELRLAKDLVEGPRRHRLIAMARGRAVDTRFGGEVVTRLGPAAIDERIETPRPNKGFGAQTADIIRQTFFGLGYEGRWGDWLELSAGLQRTEYRKTVTAPDTAPEARRDRPVLANALAGVNLSPRLALYAGFTQGLEESGTAPGDASNSGEVLPALRTEQFEAGTRLLLPGDLRLVVGLFRIEKPYFAFDEADLFRERGTVRHRGMEASLSGTLVPGLTLLAGGVLLDASVTGPEVESGQIGRRPIGWVRETGFVALDWWPDGTSPWSFDAQIDGSGPRKATNDNRVALPAVAELAAGLRYRFRLGHAPAVFRVRVGNVTNRYAWVLRGEGRYAPNQARTLAANLAVDL